MKVSYTDLIREYNIPAVLAAGDATAKLKDGDTVLVNATVGSVTLLVS